MLIKSIKHDLMATYRDFVGIYVALLVAAIIGPFVVQANNSVINTMAILAMFGLTVATLVITFLTIIRLYNRRMFSNEGYLTMTLPVKTYITIISKVITGMIWSILTSLAFFLAAVIFYGIYMVLYNIFDTATLGNFVSFLKDVFQALFQWEVVKALLVQAPLLLVSGIKDLILLVFIMTFINTSFIKKGKLAIGVAAYMIIGSLISWGITAVLLLTGDPLYATASQGGLLINGMELGFAVNVLSYGIELVLTTAVIAGLGYVTWWLLEHKLEIE